MLRIKHFSFILIMLIGMVMVSTTALAQDNLDNALGNLGKTKKELGGKIEEDPAVIIGKTINLALTFVGVIFLLLMVYAGFLWMTARGKEDQITKARDMIIATVIGLVIVTSAYAITVVVTKRFADTATSPPSP